jgi:hypothetical protein
MRIGRRWQRERAALADEEAARSAALLGWMMRLVSSGPAAAGSWAAPLPEETQPYRGFRAGRGRERPDGTGYGEPTSPDRERWAEPRSDDPTLDPVLGDSDDEPWTGTG